MVSDRMTGYVAPKYGLEEGLQRAAMRMVVTVAVPPRQPAADLFQSLPHPPAVSAVQRLPQETGSYPVSKCPRKPREKFSETDRLRTDDRLHPNLVYTYSRRRVVALLSICPTFFNSKIGVARMRLH
jgi:hypothetical protein